MPKINVIRFRARASDFIAVVGDLMDIETPCLVWTSGICPMAKMVEVRTLEGCLGLVVPKEAVIAMSSAECVLAAVDEVVDADSRGDLSVRYRVNGQVLEPDDGE